MYSYWAIVRNIIKGPQNFRNRINVRYYVLGIRFFKL